jgi:hypothetical protein
MIYVKVVPTESPIEAQRNALPEASLKDSLESDFAFLPDKKEEQQQELLASSLRRQSCEGAINTRNNNNRTSAPPNLTTKSPAVNSDNNTNVTIEKKEDKNITTESTLDSKESLVNIGTRRDYTFSNIFC